MKDKAKHHPESYSFVRHQMQELSDEEILRRSAAFLHDMAKRRSIREFSQRQVPQEVMENVIATASSAPSGANKQPWTFCLVGDKGLKEKIRQAAEIEEKRNYNGRMSESWLSDLAPLGTDWHKPFLEDAPWLVVVFKRIYELDESSKKHHNYYVNESVGIAVGFLLSAVHQAGLCALTHTPSPMNFLTQLLGRPENERAYLLIPVGHPAAGTTVPHITKRPLNQVITIY